MAVRLYFEGRKDKGGSLKGERMCGEKERFGENNGCSVRASKWGEVHVFQFLPKASVTYVATEQFCMPVEACDG